MASNYREIAGPSGPLATLQDFEGNSLRGYAVAGRDSEGLGRLSSAEDVAAWYAADGHLMYVVRSYCTPIGWVTDDGRRYCVTERFSVTTSKQQTYVRAWLGAGTPTGRSE